MFLFAGRMFLSRPKTMVVALVLAVLVGTGAGLYGYALHRWHEAQAAVKEGRPGQARTELDFCLTLWPNSPEVQLLAARVSRLSGDLTGAEAHLKQCLRLQNGPSEDTQLEFLLLRLQAGEEDEVAPELFRLVDQKHRESPVILESVARAYMLRLRYGPAYNCLNRWTKMFPGAAKPYYWRGWVLERLDNPREAMKEYQKAIELDPDMAQARLRIAEMHLEDNQPQRALDHLERLRGTCSERELPRVEARLGQCRLLQGQTTEARKLLESAVNELPDDVPVLLNLGKLELQEVRPVQAEAWLRRALQADPMDTEVQFNLATSLAFQGRTEEADAMMARYEKEKAILKRANSLLKDEARGQSIDPTAPTEVGSLLLEMGHDRQGLYWLEQALLRDANFQSAHRALADYYEKKGDSQKAAAHRARLTTERPKKVAAP
jgi:tetratricopeptide (TPR) repeat protein